MSEFLASLTTLDKVFLICAVVGSILFLIRLVLQLMGADSDTDFDVDFDGDVDVGSDSDHSFTILSYLGISVFTMMFGLEGLCFHKAFGFGPAISLAAGIGAGVISVWIIQKLMSAFASLQSSGTINMHNAIGEKGSIYLHIPRNGVGKARVKVQGRLKVLDAVAEDKKEIKTGERIEVVDLLDNTLVVKKC